MSVVDLGAANDPALRELGRGRAVGIDRAERGRERCGAPEPQVCVVLVGAADATVHLDVRLRAVLVGLERHRPGDRTRKRGLFVDADVGGGIERAHRVPRDGRGQLG